MSDEQIVIVKFSDIEEGPIARWPKCHECSNPAVVVYASPNWYASGFKPRTKDQPKGVFCCITHSGDFDYGWYWMWIAGKDKSGFSEHDPWLWDRDFMTHVAAKTWGRAFLSWLLDQNLSSYAETAAFRKAK